MELDDFVYSMPPQNSEGLQKLIAEKEEFAEFASSPTEKIPTRGEYFNHQNFIARYMLFYKRILLMHSTGTGKSCAAVATSEKFKENFADSLASFVNSYITPRRTHIRHIYLLVKGKTLAVNFEDLLVCTCTKKGIYETDSANAGKNFSAKKSAIRANIKKHYTISPYVQFINKFMNRVVETEVKGKDGKSEMKKILISLSNDELKEKFNNTLFIIDEAHSLRIDVSLSIDTDELIKSADSRSTTIASSVDRELDSDDIKKAYKKLKKIFTITNCSVMLMTATPLVNKPTEINHLMELLNDGTYPKMPSDIHKTDRKFYYYPRLDELAPFLRGRISYVSQLKTGAIPVYEGDEYPITIGINEDFDEEIVYEEGEDSININLTAVAVPMSDEQTKYFRDVEKTEQIKTSFRLEERNASTFMFPQDPKQKKGTIQKAREGYDKYFVKGSSVPTKEFKEILKDLNMMKILSEKYVHMFSEIMKSVEEKDGTCFAYFPFIKAGGADVFAAFLEAQGLERFNEGNTIFEKTGDDARGSSGRGYCVSSDIYGKRDVAIEYDYRPERNKVRFAFMTSNTTIGLRSSILEAFNTYANRNGEIIKILIGSRIAGEGISLFNGTKVFLPYPLWNRSDEFQAISRMIRSTSHVYLMEDKRKNMKPGDPEPFINVRIYKYMAIPSDFDIENATDYSKAGIDFQLLVLSKKKEYFNEKMLKIMRACAVDCIIHKSRNFPDREDENICLDEINLGKSEIGHDKSTKLLLFSNDDVENMKEYIIWLMSRVFSIKLSEILDILKIESNTYRIKILLLAIEKLVLDKTTIRDPFWRRSFLSFDGDNLFLTNGFRSENFINAFYSRNAIITVNSSQGNVIREKILKSEKQIAEDLKIDFEELILELRDRIKDPGEMRRHIISRTGTGHSRSLVQGRQQQLNIPSPDDPKDTFPEINRYLLEVLKFNDLKEEKNRLDNIISNLSLETVADLVEKAISERFRNEVSAFGSFIIERFQNNITTISEGKAIGRGRATSRFFPAEPTTIIHHDILSGKKMFWREYILSTGKWRDLDVPSSKRRKKDVIEESSMAIPRLKNENFYIVKQDNNYFAILNKPNDIIGKGKKGSNKGILVKGDEESGFNWYELLLILKYINVPPEDNLDSEDRKNILISKIKGVYEKYFKFPPSVMNDLKAISLENLRYILSWSDYDDFPSIVIDESYNRKKVYDLSGRNL